MADGREQRPRASGHLQISTDPPRPVTGEGRNSGRAFGVGAIEQEHQPVGRILARLRRGERRVCVSTRTVPFSGYSTTSGMTFVESIR